MVIACAVGLGQAPVDWLHSPIRWALGGVASLILLLALWLELPTVVARTRRKARDLETRGDGMLASHPVRSLALYRKVQRTAIDEGQRARLQRKIGYLREQISEASEPASAAAAPAGWGMRR